LVVEDKPLIRMVAVELLQNAGLAVCEAGCADDAIPILETHETRVLFTDVRMPGSMDGLEFGSLRSGAMAAGYRYLGAR
jgi:CheY-like chemotaxis protein